MEELEYPRIVSTDVDVLWLLATFDTLLKIAKRFSSAVVIASS
jgi:hypothetical protein